MVEYQLIDEDKFSKIWRALDTRIATINERTKAHTIQIRELKKELNKLYNKKNRVEIQPCSHKFIL